jgi:hypothetical protein
MFYLAGDELGDDASAGDAGLGDGDALHGGGVRGLVVPDDAHPLVGGGRGLHGSGGPAPERLAEHEVFRRLHRGRVLRRDGLLREAAAHRRKDVAVADGALLAAAAGRLLARRPPRLLLAHSRTL